MKSAPAGILSNCKFKIHENQQRLSTMVDNLQLELLSVQFSGELMPQAHIEMCSIIDISNPYLTVNPPRLPVPVH